MVRNRAFTKDTLREIRKSISRYLAIVAIVALGVAFFVGIKTTNPDMKVTAHNYFTAQRFMDFRLVSNVGITVEDVQALRAIPGVKGAMPFDSLDAVVTVGGTERVFHVESLPDAAGPDAGTENDVNRPFLIEGRLPAVSGECVVERNTMTGILYAIGDRIRLDAGNGGTLSDRLATSDFTVVGIVETPLYISRDRGTTTIGSGQVSAYLLIPLSDFKQEFFSSVFLTMTTDEGVMDYSPTYDDRAAEMKTVLEVVSTARAEIRHTKIVDDATALLDTATADYLAQVADARKQLADALSKIQDGQKTIDDGRVQLAAAEKSAGKKFASAQKGIDAGLTSWKTSWDAYASNRAEFDLAVEQAKAAGVYDLMKAQFDAQEAGLNAALAQLQAGRAQIVDQQSLLDKSKKKATTQFASTKLQLDQAQTDLDASKATYETGVAETNAKLADGQAQLDASKAKILEIPAVEWFVLDRQSNSGYVDYGGAADRLDAIAQVFPILFILVALLICFASMSRMVEEQRSYMGTVKSLGYSKARIARKFLVYSVSASLLGGLVGLWVGFAYFPLTIFGAYSALYTVPSLVRLVDVPFAAAALAVAVAVTAASALAVCLEELNSPAATLMRPRAPKPGRIILLERITPLWKRLSFTWKVTARNLFRYRTRFFMTVVGVGGCTALLLVGFGLRDAVRAIGDVQYRDIFLYEATVTLKDSATTEERAAVQKAVTSQPGFAASQERRYESVTLSKGGVTKDVSLVVPEDAAGMERFVVLRDRTTHTVIPLGDKGVVLTEKVAAMIGVAVGDKVILTDGNGKAATVRVTGIAENYLRHFAYMTPALYETLLGAAPLYNQTVVELKNTTAAAQEAFAKDVVSTEGIASIMLTSDNLATFNNMIGSVYSIVLVLIISAGLLSFIVLFTLTNINITERMREIATIKVLGFHDREVASYIFRENLILTALGTVAGLLAGSPLAKFVIGSAEVEMVMFGRQIYPESFAMAALLTLAFALSVNAVMIGRLKRIDMIEALKTVE
jgi:putative ABC transport system permease protein